MRFAEGHVMQDDAMVPRNPDGHPPGRPLMADGVLGNAQAEGVELPADGLLSQATMALLGRALAAEMIGHLIRQD